MSEFKPAASCEDDWESVHLKVEDAVKQLLAAVPAPGDSESVHVQDCLDRILSADIRSTVDVPPHSNSAMDGYALKGTDLPQQEHRDFSLIGQVLAGNRFNGTVEAGQCVRIMTGAPMPDGADTVVMQERVQLLSQDRLRIFQGNKPGQNVRQAGEDIQKGSVVVQCGQRLFPAHMGLIASIGINEVEVYRRPRVAILSTGEELQSAPGPLAPGKIFDSNRYTLIGMLRRLGVVVVDLGVVTDQPDAIRSAFKKATASADALITSGGVSVGEADYVKQILEELGDISFWQVAMKPGRPFAFGQLADTQFFGLPGNPVAVMVTFYQIVRPALQKMMGEVPHAEIMLKLPSRDRFRKKPGRREFQRGQMFVDDDGQLAVRKTGMQGSGILSSMADANCFVVLPEAEETVEPGDLVSVQPFFGLV